MVKKVIDLLSKEHCNIEYIANEIKLSVEETEHFLREKVLPTGRLKFTIFKREKFYHID